MSTPFRRYIGIDPPMDEMKRNEVEAGEISWGVKAWERHLYGFGSSEVWSLLNLISRAMSTLAIFFWGLLAGFGVARSSAWSPSSCGVAEVFLGKRMIYKIHVYGHGMLR